MVGQWGEYHAGTIELERLVDELPEEEQIRLWQEVAQFTQWHKTRMEEVYGVVPEPEETTAAPDTNAPSLLPTAETAKEFVASKVLFI